MFKWNACCIINQVIDVKCCVNNFALSNGLMIEKSASQSGYVNLCNTVDKIMFLSFNSPLMQHDSFNNTLKLSVK